MFLYTSGSTGTPKGVVLSHQSHIWVVETRLAPGLDRHRYPDRRAALPHERAGAVQARLRGARHHRAAAAVHRARLYRGDRALPLHLAHRGAADDRHDAAGEATCSRSTDLSSVEFIRMGSAPVSQSLMQAIHATLPQASVTNAYGTTEAGPVVFGPHPQGLPQPEMSVGYPHPKVELRLVDGEIAQRRAGRARDEMSGGDERLSQPAGAQAAVHRRRLLHHRRRVPARRRRLPLFRRPHRRHVRVRRREHLSGRCRTHAGAPSRRRAGRGGADRRRHQGPEAGRLRGAASRPHAGRRRDQALRARQCAGLCASALRVVRRRTAARLDQQDRPQPAARDGSGARWRVLRLQRTSVRTFILQPCGEGRRLRRMAGGDAESCCPRVQRRPHPARLPT